MKQAVNIRGILNFSLEEKIMSGKRIIWREVDRINTFPVAEKIQLEVPPLIKLKPLQALWFLMTGR